jgi:ATP-dependent DNA helicase RecQ
MPAASPTWSLDALKRIIARHWGFRGLRPLQEQAMRATLDGRDSLVVLPTGGGKSLCYQAPVVLRGDTTVVVSPLISLMKDQVDRLQSCGVPAVQINSGQSPRERNAAEKAVADGKVRLVFVAPERLVMPAFQKLLQRIDVRSLAIDEAHCISHWGHDFRPEYRQLDRLRDAFPAASLHGYTATATLRVREDIAVQLRLREPAVLVGSFDRPNLTYRVARRDRNPLRQVRDVLDRHKGEAGIIYSTTRKQVDELAADLQREGVRVLPYHAGKGDEERKSVQNAFSRGECDLIVATVAFGMGIDRSNIRFVLHAGMPKSLEHYQQEAGRAGRDGLEAECVLLYASDDVELHRWMIEKSATNAEAPVPPEVVSAAYQHVDEMYRYCLGSVCRHRALVEYFGQQYTAPSCGACDLCLGDTRIVADALVVAQKVLSCVARVKEQFGSGHVTDVLRGRKTPAVVQAQHDGLSTYGLLREHDEYLLHDWIAQLIAQGVLVQQPGADGILCLNEASWEVMGGQRLVRLVQPVKKRQVQKAAASWQGVDRELFEVLRGVRQQLARQREIPPDVIFSDLTLRELAWVRPETARQMEELYGVGKVKVREFGPPFLAAIRNHRLHGSKSQALLKTVLENPDDVTMRLAYAAKLEEHGDPRGEFIRVQCRLAEMPAGDRQRRPLEERVRELLKEHEAVWVRPFRALVTAWEFHRGFVEWARLPAEEFLRGGGELFRFEPVRCLHVHGMSDLNVSLVLASWHLMRLTGLDLSGNVLKTAGLRALLDSTRLGGLRELHLNGCGLGDAGVALLAKSRRVATLAALSLDDNRLGDAGGRALLRSSHLGNVRVLSLRQNRLSERCQQELRTRFGERVVL